MTKQHEIYQCQVCGNITEVKHASGGTLSCCKQPMSLLTENTTDASKEKHVPLVEKTAGGYRVSVGSVAHPMTADHYIEWIELVAGSTLLTRYLKPGELPVAEFSTDESAVYARAYCNLHGNWRAN